MSTEDVAKGAQRKLPTTPPVVFTYQYLDSTYKYMLQPSTSSSGEYLLTFEPHRLVYFQLISNSTNEQYIRRENPNFMVKTPCDGTPPKPPTRSQQQNSDKPKKGHGPCYSYGGHLCSPCVTTGSNNGKRFGVLFESICDQNHSRRQHQLRRLRSGQSLL